MILSKTDFFDAWSWFKFNNLRPVLRMYEVCTLYSATRKEPGDAGTGPHPFILNGVKKRGSTKILTYNFAIAFHSS